MLKRILLVFVLLIVLLPLSVFLFNEWNMSRKFEAERDAMRALGLPGTWEELLAWREAEKPAVNAWDKYDEAMTAVMPETANGDRVCYELDDNLPIVGHSEEPVLRLDDALAAKTREYLACYASAIPLFHEAAAIETAQLPMITYIPEQGDSNPDSTRIEARAFMLQVARLLALNSMLATFERDADEVVRCIVSGLRVARQLENDTAVIGGMVAIACEGIALDALSKALATDLLQRPHLETLAAALDRDLQWAPRPYAEEFSYPPNAVPRSTDNMGILDAWENLPYIASLRGKTIVMLRASIHSLSNEEEQALLQWLAHVRQIAELVAKGSGNAVETFLARDGRTRSDLDPVNAAKLKTAAGASAARPFLDPSGAAGMRSLVAVERAWALRRAARVALSIELYRREHGSLPETLQALAPAFIEELPVDPCSKGDLLYRRTDGGYIVYSVGSDGADDGGFNMRTSMERHEDMSREEFRAREGADDIVFEVTYADAPTTGARESTDVLPASGA